MDLLSVNNLKVDYEVENGMIHAVNDVTFEIPPESLIGIVGESGCGKSTLAQTLIRNFPSNLRIPSGEIRFMDEDILSVSDKRLRELRWEHIALIPQDAMNCLDPVFTIQEQLVEAIIEHRPDVSNREARNRAEEVLDIVGISASRLTDYPHQMSGGMKQRIIIAMSMILEPELIIADEPTTGLDVLIKDKILSDLEKYRDEFETSVLFISHDLADMMETCDELIVMYGGKIVEQGQPDVLFTHPTHPYTMGLKYSLPTIHSTADEIISMNIEPPNLRSPPKGCIFSPKCPFVVPECTEKHPPLEQRDSGVISACYRAEEGETLRSLATEVSWTD